MADDTPGTVVNNISTGASALFPQGTIAACSMQWSCNYKCLKLKECLESHHEQGGVPTPPNDVNYRAQCLTFINLSQQYMAMHLAVYSETGWLSLQVSFTTS